MNKIIFILSSIILFSCAEKNKHTEKPIAEKKDTLVEQQPTKVIDTVTWINDLREFRNALYQNDKNKVKQFIQFPLINDNNEIWYLIYGDDEKTMDKIAGANKSFTESDFDKHFNKLFPRIFITVFLKIKTEELYTKGEAETVEIKEGNTTYKLYATVDNATKILSLNLASNTIIKDNNGEVQDGGEFSVIYQFDILDKKQTRFKGVRLAG